MDTFALVFFIAAALALAAGLGIILYDRRRCAFGVTAEATLVERRMLGNNNRSCFFLVSFDVDGVERQAFVDANRAKGDPAPGTMLLIGYDPAEPRRAVLRKRAFPAAVFGLAAVFALFGAFLQIAATR